MNPVSVRVSAKEPGIMAGLIFIKGIRFFINQDIGMLIKEVFIIKGDMAFDAQAVGDEGKLSKPQNSLRCLA